MRTDWPIVLADDDGIRPAGKPDECFYCGRRIGQEHKDDCVIVTKLVRVEYSFVVDVRVPHFWTPDDVEHHRNESSWCANNALEEIKKEESASPCWCFGVFRAKMLGTVDNVPRRGFADED